MTVFPTEAAMRPSPCVEGNAFDAYEGGGQCVRGLGGDRLSFRVLDRRPSRWTHRVGVSCACTSTVPTRNAIGLSSPACALCKVELSELSPWRSVLPPPGGGASQSADGVTL